LKLRRIQKHECIINILAKAGLKEEQLAVISIQAQELIAIGTAPSIFYIAIQQTTAQISPLISIHQHLSVRNFSLFLP